MCINLYQDQMQKAFLFGTAVLYSEKPIPREDVPQYWHGYELRGCPPAGQALHVNGSGGQKFRGLDPVSTAADPHTTYAAPCLPR